MPASMGVPLGDEKVVKDILARFRPDSKITVFGIFL